MKIKKETHPALILHSSCGPEKVGINKKAGMNQKVGMNKKAGMNQKVGMNQKGINWKLYFC